MPSRLSVPGSGTALALNVRVPVESKVNVPNSCPRVLSDLTAYKSSTTAPAVNEAGVVEFGLFGVADP